MSGRCWTVSLLPWKRSPVRPSVSAGEKGWSFWNSINHGFGASLELESWVLLFFNSLLFCFLLTLLNDFVMVIQRIPPPPYKIPKAKPSALKIEGFLEGDATSRLVWKGDVQQWEGTWGANRQCRSHHRTGQGCGVFLVQESKLWVTKNLSLR